ncbi:hypothetical protein C8Q75DRAFT_803291 [Abortiporus biennis]|nr:hypothetical protein C8Q75DRAFT_803291 [Abortiporus biennis]
MAFNEVCIPTIQIHPPSFISINDAPTPLNESFLHASPAAYTIVEPHLLAGGSTKDVFTFTGIFQDDICVWSNRVEYVEEGAKQAKLFWESGLSFAVLGVYMPSEEDRDEKMVCDYEPGQLDLDVDIPPLEYFDAFIGTSSNLLDHTDRGPSAFQNHFPHHHIIEEDLCKYPSNISRLQSGIDIDIDIDMISFAFLDPGTAISEYDLNALASFAAELASLSQCIEDGDLEG